MTYSNNRGFSSKYALGFGIFASFFTISALWYLFALKPTVRSIKAEEEEVGLDEAKAVPLPSKTTNPSTSNSTKPETNSTKVSDESKKKVHSLVEIADKRGKDFFKAKNYLEAATCFTEALDLIEESKDSSLSKQVVTLLNNRSAMYEKANLSELALVDCEKILELDMTHSKARMRKLRLLESLKRYREALVEVCAIQLRFMRENRDKIAMGFPINPPIPQEKIEELMGYILPAEMEETLKRVKDKPRDLPSNYTIQQLLKSFTGYNKWMAQAAKMPSALELTALIQNSTLDAERASILFQRGIRYMYDGRYDDATKDFEASFALAETDDSIQEYMGDEQYRRLLEWMGMSRHLRYNLTGASECYEKCSNLEPENAELLVKRAGVQMDAGKIDESLELFDAALGLDPKNVDALLHRSNLRMLQQNVTEAQKDLEACLKLKPDHLLARLRLATVYMATNDLNSAKESLDKAQQINPKSSEVHSYRGEMHFAQGEFSEAKDEFSKAIECEPGNPTPYVNAALAMMNAPGPSGGPPDIKGAMDLLQKSIDVDPMFQVAFVHLGQMKLSMATNLTEAQQVVALYDKGINQCRSAEELKDLVSMRLLTVAQVDAAKALGMETLNMQ